MIDTEMGKRSRKPQSQIVPVEHCASGRGTHDGWHRALRQEIIRSLKGPQSYPGFGPAVDANRRLPSSQQGQVSRHVRRPIGPLDVAAAIIESMTRIGVIGCGGMGNVHGNKYALMPDVELHCFDVDSNRREEYTQARSATPHESLEALLSAVDAVDVCLPTDLHAQTAEQVIQAGKHLLVEKPITLDPLQAEHLAHLAKQAGVHLVPAHVVRFFPEFRSTHDAVVAGKIGVPAVARTRRGGKAPLAAKAWYRDIERSGGIIMDLAVHDLDWMRWTLGPVTSVYARSLETQGTREDWNGDYALISLTFASGALGHIEATWMDPAGFRTAIEVAGSEGLVEYDSRQAGSLRVSREAASSWESPLLATDDPYYQQLRAFVDTVQGKRESAISPEEGIEAVRLASAALRSARTKELVRLA